MISAEQIATIEKVLGAAKVASSFNIGNAVLAFEGADAQTKIDTGLLAAEDVAKIVGYFVPLSATVAQYIELLRIVLPIAVVVIHKLPPPEVLQPGEFEAWGHIFSGTITQGELKW